MASSRRASTRGWPRSPIGSSRSPSHTGTGPPSRTARSRSKRCGRVDQVLQRLVAQARRVEAAELHGLGVGGEREQEVGGRRELVAEALGLLRSGLERALGGVGERQPALARAVADADADADVVGAQRHEQRDACPARRAAGGPCRSRRCAAPAPPRGPARSPAAPRRCSARTPAEPSRAGSAATARRPAAPGARDWTECPAPRTTTSLPCGVCAACSRAHGSGVERSWSPASSSVGTGGRSPLRGGAGAGVGGQRRQVCAKPLPTTVARS